MEKPNNSNNNEESIFLSLIEAIPIIKDAIPVDCMFGLTDKEKFLFYLAGENIDAKVSPGIPIPHQSGLYKCQQSGEKILLVLPKEVYGISVKTSTVPIKNNKGNIIGALSIGLSVDTQTALHESAQTITATSEEICATMDELTLRASKLTRELESLKKIGENTINEIKKTSEILQFVNKVAKNSNLLGLNASIEASRAGEEGRGFTVVAKEIRKMADNSAKSVKDINEILLSIENGVSNIMDTLVEITQLSEEQSDATEEISVSMQQFTSSAADVERIAKTAI